MTSIFDASKRVLFGTLGGVALLYRAHVWMDCAWLGGTTTLAGHGKALVGKVYRTLLVVFRVAVGFFGVIFIQSALL